MLYHLHELNRTMLNPLVAWSEAGARIFSEAESWLSRLPGADRVAANYELMYRLGKEYEKPAFDIRSVRAHGHEVPIAERVDLAKPFCNLVRFKRYSDELDTLKELKDDPTVLVVAPLSGHHSTLLRDTVRTLLQDHKVYVTDWVDARMVPAEQGTFHLDDYVAYMQEFIRFIGASNLHVISVCQPTVPVLAAISLMASNGETTPTHDDDDGRPDRFARLSPTRVNNLATSSRCRGSRTTSSTTCRRIIPARGRKVYPGFLQHAGFVAMNPSRHFMSHWDFYQDLLRGDLDDAESHRKFYDEYNAVLDMPARTTSTPSGSCSRSTPCRGDLARRRPARRARSHQEDRAVHDRGRTRRHLRPRPDRSRTRAVQQNSGPGQAPPDRPRRRPLRHLQRHALARDGLPGSTRLHPPGMRKATAMQSKSKRFRK